jgi:hypothetical protein
MRYGRGRQNLDHHPNYILAAFRPPALTARVPAVRPAGMPCIAASPCPSPGRETPVVGKNT